MSSKLSPRRGLTVLGLQPWFVIGILATGLLVNASHSLMDNLVRNFFGIESPIVGPFATFGVSLLIGVIVVLLVAMFAPSQITRTPVSPHSGETLAPKKRGLILLVSNPESASKAISHHFVDGPLEKVWLIPSHGNDATFFGLSTAPTAEEIKRRAGELASLQKRPLAVEIEERGVSPANAQETYDCVRQIFRKGPLLPDEIVADFTGGTKPMTIGMIMACLTPERDMEYVSLHGPTKTMHGPFRIDYRTAAFDLKHEAA